ncbi:MAG: HAMP domain-containing sensor histidine kinase [Acidimicrobiia bacterium]
MKQANRRPASGRRIGRPASDAFVLVAAATAVVVLLVLAIAVVNREDASRAADDARVAILAEGTLSAASAVENAASQVLLAVTITDANDVGTNDVVATSLAVVDRTANELDRRLDVFVAELPPNEQAAATRAVATLDAATGALIDASERADLQATAAAAAKHTVAYEQLVDEFVATRDGYVQDVLLSGQSLGRVADAVRFMVFFFLPLMLIIVYRRGARRREDAHRLEEALVSERALTQSRDDFIADLSHELRTPLTGIYGFALALGDSSSLVEEDRELAKHIVSDAAELNRMVDDLITTGRIAAGTLAMSTEDLHLEPVVTEVADVFSMRGIPVGVRVPDVIVRADRLGLRQLILNLVANAARHGGDEISVEAVMREGAVSMRVIDNGPGVPEDIEPYLFNRYLHGGGRALLWGSVGLGTAVAAAYAESFGGTIQYLRDNEWTIFEVRLPAVISDTASALV